MHVVFVAPFFQDTTLRFVRAAAQVGGARLSLLTQEPVHKVPEDLRRTLSGFAQVANALDTQAILQGVRQLQAKHGPVVRLLGALEHIQVQLAEVRAALGIAGMLPAQARNFRDKAQMKDCFEAAGIPCARHKELHSAEDAWLFARQIGYPLVIKPREGAGSVTTYRVDDDAQLAAALQAVRPSLQRPAVAEEFVVGSEHSFEVVSIGGQPVWHSLSHYLPNPLDAVRNPWIQWCVLLPRDISGPEFEPARKAGFAALQSLGMGTGLTHMEWFRRKDGSLAVSEIAARPPGANLVRMNSLAHDFDLFNAWARLMMLDQFPRVERKYAVGCAFFRGQGLGGQIRRVHGLAEAQAKAGGLVVETKLPRVGAAPSSSYEGDGWAIVRHPQTEVVQEALQHLVANVRVELG